MIRKTSLYLAALLLACSPQPEDNSEVEPATSRVQVPVGPPGLELGTPLGALTQSELELATICFQARETEPNYYSADLSAQTAADHPVADIVQNLDHFYIGEFFGDVVLFDASCSSALRSTGESTSLTPSAAAELMPQAPLTQSFANAVTLAEHLEGGGNLAISGRYDVGGTTVPMIVYLNQAGIEAVHLSFGSFTQSKLDRLLGELRQRYDMVVSSEAQESDFTSGRSQCLGFASRDAQVFLIAQQNVGRSGDLLDLIYQGPEFRARTAPLQQCLPDEAQPTNPSGRL